MRKWGTAELETVVCDCCGGASVRREFVRGDGMRVVECGGCGLAYLNPRPRAEFIKLFYGPDYFTGASSERGEGGLSLSADAPMKSGWRPRVLDLMGEQFGGIRGKDVLELGCAYGHLLERLVAEGANAKGVELSQFAAAQARARGLDVEIGTIEGWSAAHPESADVLFAMEVIEHVTSPSEFLRHAHRILRPGGLLVISTPNYGCTRRFGQRWLGLNASYEHLYFFSNATLERIARPFALRLRHSESSGFLGGPKPPDNTIRHQFERIRTVMYFLSELGWWRGLDAVRLRSRANLPYPVGHTLLVALERVA